MGKLKIGVHEDIVNLGNNRIESYSKHWIKFLLEQNVEVIDLDLLTQDGFEQALSCDGVMWRYLHIPNEKQAAPQILNSLNLFKNIEVYPNIRMSQHFDDKVMQSYILKSLDIPTPENWIFWDQNSAETWAGQTDYPKVFKLRSGAGSTNVFLIESKNDALKYINIIFSRGIFSGKTKLKDIDNSFKLKTIFSRIINGGKYVLKDKMPPPPTWAWQIEKNYIYFQEFVAGNDYDTRVIIIGNRAFANRRFNRPNDFRASGAALNDFSPKDIDSRCIELAFKISQDAGYDCMGYDLIIKNSKPVIIEMCYSFPIRLVSDCPGHWDNKLNWVDGKMRPEEAQVLDFLAKIRKRKNNK